MEVFNNEDAAAALKSQTSESENLKPNQGRTNTKYEKKRQKTKNKDLSDKYYAFYDSFKPGETFNNFSLPRVRTTAVIPEKIANSAVVAWCQDLSCPHTNYQLHQLQFPLWPDSASTSSTTIYANSQGQNSVIMNTNNTELSSHSQFRRLRQELEERANSRIVAKNGTDNSNKIRTMDHQNLVPLDSPSDFGMISSTGTGSTIMSDSGIVSNSDQQSQSHPSTRSSSRTATTLEVQQQPHQHQQEFLYSSPNPPSTIYSEAMAKSESSHPYCPNCNGMLLNTNQLGTIPELSLQASSLKADHGFWNMNHHLQYPVHRTNSIGGFTLNGHENRRIKRSRMSKFCSSHKIALVVSTFSLLVTIGLVITLILMKNKGMMEPMR